MHQIGPQVQDVTGLKLAAVAHAAEGGFAVASKSRADGAPPFGGDKPVGMPLTRQFDDVDEEGMVAAVAVGKQDGLDTQCSQAVDDRQKEIFEDAAAQVERARKFSGVRANAVWPGWQAPNLGRRAHGQPIGDRLNDQGVGAER